MNGPIPGYDLARPSAADLESSLRELVGPRDYEAALARGLREIDRGVAEGTHLSDLDDTSLLALAEAFARQRGLVAVLGRSFVVRMRSYLELSRASMAVGASAS